MMKKPVSAIVVPEGSDPEEVFEHIVTHHAMANGITPNRIEWEKITCPETGVFLVPIKDHPEGPMKIVAILGEDERSASERGSVEHG
jgi:hypothetical protein